MLSRWATICIYRWLIKYRWSPDHIWAELNDGKVETLNHQRSFGGVKYDYETTLQDYFNRYMPSPKKKRWSNIIKTIISKIFTTKPISIDVRFAP